jgi:hypothetical protein
MQSLLKDTSNLSITLDNWKNKDYDANNKYTLIKGFVQSGKTNYFILQAIYNYLQGIKTIIVLRNQYGDKHQFMSRLNTKLIEYNIPPSALINITVILGNICQLKKAIETVTNSDLIHKFVLMIDEVDFLDHEGKDQKSIALVHLKSIALHTYGVSATVIDTFIQESITHRNIKIINTQSNYKSIKEVDWKIIDKPSTKKSISIIEKFKLNDFLDKLTNWNPIFCPEYDDYHPIIYLLKITSKILTMNYIQDYIYENYPDITTIVYNGNGNRIGITGQPIFTQKCSIGSSLTMLKEGGWEKYPRILIISGELASRGISFVSDDYTYSIKNNKLPWHLTGQYYYCSNQTKMPEIIQNQRYLGNFNDSIKIRCYTTEKLKEDILKAYNLNDVKLINDTIEISKEHNILTKHAIFKVKLSKKDMITRKLGKKHELNDLKNNLKEDVNNYSNTGIYNIIRENLAISSQKIYDIFIEELKKTKGWIEKSVLINNVIEIYQKNNPKKNASHLTNISHHWHNPEKKGYKYFKYTDDEKTGGLLFKKEGLYWYAKYNK